MSATVPALPTAPPSLITRVAQRFGVEPNKMLATLKATAFRQRATDPEPTNEQMMALLVVADQHGLNPWTRELYAFPDKGAIVPVVGVDGWSRIVNEHPQFDGVEFEYGPPAPAHKNAPEWVECVIFRRDRTHPTRVREHLSECYRDTGPWKSHPARMLRHKAFMQAGRLAFSFSGLFDEDDAHRILEGEATRVPGASAAIASINAAVAGTAPALEHHAIEGVATTVPQEPATVAAGSASATSAAQPAATGTAPAFTYAEVREKLEAAKNADELADAVSLIDAVPDPAHRAELHAVNEHRIAALGI